MRDLTLSIGQTEYIRKPKSPAKILRFNLILLIVITLIGLVYLLEINSLGTKGYQIRQLEVKLKQLEIEQKNLQVQASSLQSINRIEQEAVKLNFVPAGNVTYIKDQDFALK